MPLFAAGVSHHQVAADSVAALTRHTADIVDRMKANDGVHAVVALATCNRFELYLDVDGFHSAVDQSLAAIAASVPELDAAVLESFVIFAGQGVVEHLFEVACGLDSMVVGEVEIVGQVRDALANSDGDISPPLRRLFQNALTTSKAVIARTELGAAGRSIASVGLDLAEPRLVAWSQARVLVIGTGTYARVVVADLTRRGCARVSVYSGSGQAERFAASHPVHPLRPGDLAASLQAADLVVTCSGNGGEVLSSAIIATSRTSSNGILPIVDLSGGTDVAIEVDQLAQVDVITLDRIGTRVPPEHASAILDARDIVNRAVATYFHLEEGRTATPAVTAMRAHVARIIELEIENAGSQYSPETAEAIARSLRRVSNSLLHAPSVRAAELARAGDLSDYHHALHTLFGIVVDAP
ncbi:MAG: glutamyl-tRNA reductase [Propionicimonas sp.]